MFLTRLLSVLMVLSTLYHATAFLQTSNSQTAFQRKSIVRTGTTPRIVPHLYQEESRLCSSIAMEQMTENLEATPSQTLQKPAGVTLEQAMTVTWVLWNIFVANEDDNAEQDSKPVGYKSSSRKSARQKTFGAFVPFVQ